VPISQTLMISLKDHSGKTTSAPLVYPILVLVIIMIVAIATRYSSDEQPLANGEIVEVAGGQHRTGSQSPETVIDPVVIPNMAQRIQKAQVGHADIRVADRLKFTSLPLQDRVAPASLRFHELKKDLRKGTEVTLPLMNGETVTGWVNLVQADEGGWLRAGGRLTGKEAGTFSLAYRGEETHARILLTDRRLAYEVSQAEQGQLQIHERPLSDVVCNQVAAVEAKEIQATEENQVLVPILSSRPEAEAVVYLDFDGETVVDADWAGGTEIVAAPSPQSSAQIEETWARVKEDYAPFNIDITTDPARYASAPVGRRMRIIITPTAGWYEGASTVLGIAYRNSFARAGTQSYSSDISCWMFTRPDNTAPYLVADVVSHEVGHTLGLAHDGGGGDGAYYRGHGWDAKHWVPLMGGTGPMLNAASVTQWSKGEYAGANNFEDDLAIIASATNGFGYIPDDYADEPGGEVAQATTPLGMNDRLFEQSGMIHSAADADCFSFVSQGGYLDISAAPTRHLGNLDLALELLDEAGTVLETASPDDSRSASFSQKKLAAGTYYIKVRGSGRGDPLNQGYSSYGSLGEYTITGSQRQGYLLVQEAGYPLNSLNHLNLGWKSTDGESLKRTLTLINTGDEAVTGLSASYTGEGMEHFSANFGGVTTLAAGASVNFEVLFTPTAVGDFTVTLDIQTDQPQEYRISLLAQSTLPSGPPLITQEPKWSIRELGESVTFSATADGGIPRSWQWFKEIKGVKKDIAGATDLSLTLNPLKSADAAFYGVRVTNNEGFVESFSAALAIVEPVTMEINVKEGGTATFAAKAHLPAGYESSITYEWSKDGHLLPDLYNKTEVKLTKLSAATAGHYTCRALWYHDLEVLAAQVIVRVVPKPVLDPIILPDLMVSQEVDITVSGQHFPTSFTAKGLPPGIVLNKTTGKLTGRPKAAKMVKGVAVPYQVTFSAANATGTANVPVTATWMVSPLHKGHLGLFHGLVDRHPVLNENLGGTMLLTVLPTGNFSGTLKLGSASHKLKGSLITPSHGGGTTAMVTVPRKGQADPLTLTLTLEPESDEAAGTVTLEGAEPCHITLHRAVWAAKNPATDYVYKSTAAIIPPAWVLEEPGVYPQGEGYLTLNVTKVGKATWAGRLADGSTFTSSTALGPGGQLVFHVLLNKKRASAQGFQVFDKDSHYLDGSLTWLKSGLPAGSKMVDRFYRDGFPEHSLQVTGGKYGYTAGSALLGLTDAQLRLEKGGLSEVLQLPLTISSRGTAQAGPNNHFFKPKIKAATGLLSGSFTLTTPVKRVGLFYGALVQRLGRGAGHFLLPEISPPPAKNSKNVPILGGNAVLESLDP
jgi:hypothetical protein